MENIFKEILNLLHQLEEKSDLKKGFLPDKHRLLSLIKSGEKAIHADAVRDYLSGLVKHGRISHDTRDKLSLLLGFQSWDELQSVFKETEEAENHKK